MKNQELFKEAIADAQMVRNAALVNAKKSLEEAFAPKIESMLTKKLAEMESTDESAGAEKNEGQKGSMEEELDSLLKELGMDENENVDESSKTDVDSSTSDLTKEGEEEGGEAELPQGGGEAEPEGGAAFGGEEESKEVVDMTKDELLSAIKDIIAQAMGGGQGLGDEEGGEFAGDVAGGDALAGGSDADVDLDELLKELESENEGKEVDESTKVDEAIATKAWHDAKAGKGKVGAPKNGGAKGFIKMKMSETETNEAAEANEAKVEEVSKELNEAIKVIKALRSSLNEVNLLNAKLLYVNKIFKAKSLTESQKVKVVSAFDKANTVNEAKLIYASLNEAFSSKKKSPIRESFGSSSKVIGGAPKKAPVIVENSTFSRFQQLAGIKPLYS